jgi:hypothetical protein
LTCLLLNERFGNDACLHFTPSYGLGVTTLSGRRRRPLKGSPPSAAQHSNRTCSFPASGFRAVRGNIPSRAQRQSVSLATANRRGFVNLVSSARARGVFHKRNWSISPDFTHHVARPLCSHHLRCLPPGPPGPVWDSGVLLRRSMVICSTLTSRCASVTTSELPYRLPDRPRRGQTRRDLLGSHENLPFRAVRTHPPHA